MFPESRRGSFAAPRRTGRSVAASLCLALSATLALGAVGGGPARADDVTDAKSSIDRQIAQLGQQLEGTNADLAAAYLSLRRTQAQLPGAQAAVTAATAAVGTAATTLQGALAAEAAAIVRRDEAAARLQIARHNEQLAVEQLARNAQAISGTQADLDAFAADVFQGGTSNDQLALIFGGTTAEELTGRLIAAEIVSGVADDTLTNLRTAEADGSATKAYLEAVRIEIDGLKAAADAAVVAASQASAAAQQAKAQATTAQSNAVAAQTALQGLQASQKALAQTVQARKADQEAQLQVAQQESARLQAILAERARQARLAEERRRAAEAAKAKANGGSTSRPPSVVTGGFRFSSPADGPITSGFGMRFHPVLQRWMLHDGLDYGIDCGTPLYAAAAGTVFSAGYNPRGWGNQVLIDHGIQRGVNVVSSYNHMSRIVVFGGSVARGQLIGYSGTTGYSTGCHLHFGVYTDGTPVNPLGWL